MGKDNMEQHHRNQAETKFERRQRYLFYFGEALAGIALFGWLFIALSFLT